MKKILMMTIASSLLLLMACGGGSGDSSQADAFSLVLKETTNKIILPTVKGFHDKSTAFKASSDDFCKTPSKPKLATLQNDWRALSTQWYKLALYNFGPVNNDLIFPRVNFIDSLRQRGKDYTSTARNEILKDLNSSENLNIAYFKAKDFKLVGLLPLELLTFETADDTHSTQAQAIVDEFKDKPRKCKILTGLSALNASIATDINSGWNTPGYKETGNSFKSLFLSNALDKGKKSIPTLIISIQKHLDYLAKRDIASKGAKVANHSFNNIQSSIDEIKLILEGSSHSKASFFSFMKAANSQGSVDTIRTNIIKIEESIKAKNTEDLKINLGYLDGNFKREVAEGLGVKLGITFTDGD